MIHNASHNLKPLLQEKIDCLRELERLSEEQLRCLKADSPEKLTALLRDKETITQRIDGMDQEIQSLQQAVSPHEAATLEPWIRTIRTVLSRLVSLEKESTELARNEMNRLQEEIHRGRHGSRAIKGYNRSHHIPTSRFLDMKDES